MFEIDLRILQKMTDELQNCERRLKAQEQELGQTIRNLNHIEMEGMDRTRDSLTKRLEDLRQETRKVRAMRQALEKICVFYEQSENRNEGLFEEKNGTDVVWQAVRLTGIRNMLR